MQYGQFHYLPVSPFFFAILAGLFVFLLVFVQLGLLRYAYMRLGLSSGAALLLLFASLVGSFFNIPVAELPAQRVMSGQEVEFFGMVYVVPVVARAPSTVIAVNVGGALIPTIVSLFLLVRHGLWLRGAVATLVVAAVCYALSQPVRGVGIAEPVFVPALTGAVVAIILSREYAAPLAYIGGSLGTLIGADLLNLGSVGGLGAPVASIGGAGTFDGIFLIGIVSVLIASLSTWWVAPPAHSRI
ncbi:MAG TPA: DUF1614 domain-containing protein [Xanthobacteraceae bacterium]|nr:DUF1614 domain-containing protein [Xanthobacteraceae bacterium]